MSDKFPATVETGRNEIQGLEPPLSLEADEIRLTTNWLSDEVVVGWPDNTRGGLSAG
jgi:hypothetical protein